METAITQGIRISVEAIYQPQMSRPKQEEHFFAYRIIIENNSENIVQLLRRHWYIFDSIDGRREVEGEGVVGQQPTLKPGETHQYVSGCPLHSDIGNMKGVFLMERKSDGFSFEVTIPTFNLIMPFKYN